MLQRHRCTGREWSPQDHWNCSTLCDFSEGETSTNVCYPIEDTNNRPKKGFHPSLSVHPSESVCLLRIFFLLFNVEGAISRNMNEDSKTAASLKGPPHLHRWWLRKAVPWNSLSWLQAALFPAIATAYITWGRDFVNLVTSGTSWDCGGCLIPEQCKFCLLAHS